VTSDTASAWPRSLPLLAALALVAAACAGTGPTGSNASSLAIEVERVSDGDSFPATSDSQAFDVRLLGLNAPERGECFANRAGDRLIELLDSGPVSISPWPGETDDFGRVLAMVTAGGVFVNLEMIESGHALARAQGDHQFQSQFEQAQQRAAEAELGLWAPDACGPAGSPGMVIEELMADAAGNDRENPNGEWVIIRNEGDTAADLEGWILRDESTRHRYEFGDLSLKPGVGARVMSGCGSDDLTTDPMELFWCAPEAPVWNNSGDTAFLLDQYGNIADHRRND